MKTYNIDFRHKVNAENADEAFKKVNENPREYFRGNTGESRTSRYCSSRDR